jgi:predicted amidophosphoribosyltransferase
MCEHVWDVANKSCLFGCNRVVDEDTGICPECHEHSNNIVECEVCGAIGNVDNYSGVITEDDVIPEKVVLEHLFKGLMAI